MHFLYNLSIYLYSILIRVAGLFNAKARQWVTGRKGIFKQIKTEIDHNRPVAWFHCASLGEFEQGRPLMENFREKYPEYQIVLTFFSPSGYEIRKNYTGADYIFYLPPDTARNAGLFIDLIKPALAVFVKYEYWFNYILQLSKRQIPLIYVSAIFRPGQRFFTSWGKWQLNILKLADHFFVQNETSRDLLEKAGIHQVTVSGDTRFDRVYKVAREKKAFAAIEKFTGKSPLLLAGSTWPADEELIFPLIQNNSTGLKFIFAPHEVHPERIESLVRKIPGKVIKYSELDDSKINAFDVLIIDSIGILSHLYQYSKIAYIGGGFGVGIHNILEAATFGNPVIFGPNYKKFQEANDLIEMGGAFSISTKDEFQQVVDKLMENEAFFMKCSTVSRSYVESKRGATEIIMDYIAGILSST
nr:3-deoxy-D-manno-octulosonic acid transferase [Bacteroidota bacterium]